MGWAGIANGRLLALGAESFEVFLYSRSLPVFPADIANLPLAIVVLRAKTNRLADLRTLIPSLIEAIGNAQPGNVVFVDASY